jgi:nicotinamide mononucleotide transporter
MSSRATARMTVFGEKPLWTGLLGNVFSLTTVLPAIRRTIWTWPVRLAGAVSLFTASVSTHTPGNAPKQVLFFALVSYGWVRWMRGIKDDRGLPVRPATGRERTALLVALAGGTAVVAALFAQSRALVDFWIIGVLVGLVGVPLAIKSGPYVSGAAYGIFFVMVLAGFRNWIKQYRRQRRSAELEAVAV